MFTLIVLFNALDHHRKTVIALYSGLLCNQSCFVTCDLEAFLICIVYLKADNFLTSDVCCANSTLRNTMRIVDIFGL